MSEIAPFIILALLILLGVMNTIHASVLGRRIDNVHRRLDLTLEDNGLKDFWKDGKAKP